MGGSAGEVLFGRAGGVVLASIVLVSVAGSLFAIQTMLPRLYYAMSRDGLFPPSLTPGFPFTAMVFLALTGLLLVTLVVSRPLQALAGTAIVLLGVPVYALIARQRSGLNS